MKLILYSAHDYEVDYFTRANEKHNYEIKFLKAGLDADSLPLAKGFDAICPFVNDQVDAEALSLLSEMGVRVVALRSAGFNNVDLKTAKEKGIKVVRVPAYSPHSVAEHSVGLMLALNRKVHRACSRVREGDFSLNGLMGFDMNGKSVGVFGMGHIGRVVCQILKGFGCQVLVHDPFADREAVTMDVEWVELDELLRRSDIVSLHCPLNEKTRYLIDEAALAKMKDGVMIINTSRGGLVDTRALIAGLKSFKISSLGLDVYEEESHLFFEDHSGELLQDDVFARLLTFPNVIITGHQGFFTHEAMEGISGTTLQNLSDIEKSGDCANELTQNLE